MTRERDLFMVFDVESIGLHGEGFAVGFVVIDRTGRVRTEDLLSCYPVHARGTTENRRWIEANVPPLSITHDSPLALRNEFWLKWMFWKGHDAVLVADCAWPVEARFLISCIDDDPEMRAWDGPCPLHDLASVILTRGGNPLAVTKRLPIELPAHNPLNDARQSARQLIAALSERGAYASAITLNHRQKS